MLPYARDYLQIIMLGTGFQMLSFGLNAIIRGEGNPRVAMITMLVSVALNAALAPAFIFGLDWGMKGAALATVLAQAAAAAWVTAYFFSGRSLLKIRAANLRLHWPLCLRILVIGSPLGAMQLAACLLQALLNQQLSAYGGEQGDLAISVMGIIYPMAMLVFMPMFGINQGAQPIIGYNYGARQFDRVKRVLQLAMLCATVLAVAGFVVAMSSPAQVIRLFNRRNEDLVLLGSHAMNICFLAMPIVGFQVIAAGYFQAVGKPLHAMFLMLSRQVLILIPALLVLPRFFGLDGVWAALPTADLASSLITGVWLFLELRQLRRKHAETGPPKPELSAPAGSLECL